jgi:hypothetical protein
MDGLIRMARVAFQIAVCTTGFAVYAVVMVDIILLAFWWELMSSGPTDDGDAGRERVAKPTVLAPARLMDAAFHMLRL